MYRICLCLALLLGLPVTSMAQNEAGIGGFGSGMGWSYPNYPTQMSWMEVVPNLPATDHGQELSFFMNLSGNYVTFPNGVGGETYTGCNLHYYQGHYTFTPMFITFGGDGRAIYGTPVTCSPGDVLIGMVQLATPGTFQNPTAPYGNSNANWTYNALAWNYTTGAQQWATVTTYQQAGPDCQWRIGTSFEENIDGTGAGAGAITTASDVPAGYGNGVTYFNIDHLNITWSGSPYTTINWTPRNYFSTNLYNRNQWVGSTDCTGQAQWNLAVIYLNNP